MMERFSWDAQCGYVISGYWPTLTVKEEVQMIPQNSHILIKSSQCFPSLSPGMEIINLERYEPQMGYFLLNFKH